MPGRNYMFTGDFVDEISRDKEAPEGELRGGLESAVSEL